MRRTQIYLREDQEEILQQIGRSTGTSLSQLIRDAIDKSFGPATDEIRRKKVIEASSDLWSTRRFSGSEYVEALRSGPEWSQRVHGLGRDKDEV